MPLAWELTHLAQTSFYLTALLALVLDLFLADPPFSLHPVVLVGKLISFFDRQLNRPLLTPAQRLSRGVLLAVFLPVGLTLALQAVLRLFFSLSPYLYLLFRLILAWQLLALKGLAQEAGMVAFALRSQGLPSARLRLARIVGRDTADLSDAEVIQAAVETVAENFADGVVAPLLFFALFDLPGMFFYKVINTMDSMLGYHNARYEDFGKAAARLDDVVNFLPARLAALCLLLATPLAGLDVHEAWRIFRRDRYKHLSPNSGQTEAVAAGALGIQLGGTHSYAGVEIVKPSIGDAKRAPEICDIDKTIRLLYLGAGMAFFLVLASHYLILGL